MNQDEKYTARLLKGKTNFIQDLKNIKYHKNVFAEEKIYTDIESNWNDNGKMVLYFMSTSSVDSENDGVYKDMLFRLQESVDNQYEMKDYTEIDVFFDGEGQIMAKYEFGKDIWDETIVNSCSKQIKTISYKLNGKEYSNEFQQSFDNFDYEKVIDQLVNKSLKAAGYEQRWHSLPDVDQTYQMIFSTSTYFDKLMNEGFFGTQAYYNSLPF